jgi:DNA-binding NtrC family response regulator
MFLDEIGEIELATQAKLLKLLEDRRVRRLGGLREREVDVRFIAASNRDLERMTREGHFRSDLYFRLRIVHIVVPPLRERASDVAILANHFLRLHGARYGRPNLRLSEAALHALSAYAWPGNVRELRNAVEQAVLLARGEVIDVAQFPACANPPHPAPPAAFDAKSPAPAETSMNLGEVERDLMVQALTRTGWNVTRAAQLLGISRDTLRYRMEKYQVKPQA